MQHRTTAPALIHGQQLARTAINPWFIAATVTIAAFMELLDTSIAIVALPYIGGGLGRSYDEVTWILTTYLCANAVVLPMTAWLSRLLGRKNHYLLCVVLFTISSLFCRLAPSLGFMRTLTPERVPSVHGLLPGVCVAEPCHDSCGDLDPQVQGWRSTNCRTLIRSLHRDNTIASTRRARDRLISPQATPWRAFHAWVRLASEIGL